MDEEILQEFLAESMENLSQLDNEIVILEKRPDDDDLIASIFRTIHTIKGTCGFIGLTGLGSVAHATENVLGRMRDHELRVTPTSISLILEGVDEIKELLHGLETTGQEPVHDNSQLIARLDELMQSADGDAGDVPAEISEAPVEATPVAELITSPAVEDSKPVAAPTNMPEEAADPSKKSISDLSIRVNVDVLDSLMNLVGELVLTRNQLVQMVRGDDESIFAAPILHLNRVTTDLQEGVMKTRMQPIGNAWGKLPRLVRDLAQQTGKLIELDMRGAETELDRTVLDAIKDPLTHMVRNSADHGLESTADRRAAGKPETGLVRLNAFHEGGHVIICVDDDGAGINAERVRQKAVENGILTDATAAGMSEKDLVNLVFAPGFSTAKEISSVSGRGVGMDVVKTQIERIGGTVDLTSRRGIGTEVRIKIPLTLAIISALVVESGGYSFAIPQLTIVELVRVAAEDRHKIETINRNEVYRLRDRLLPLIHLDRELELDDEHAGEERDVNIVVVQAGDEQFGLIVSEVFDTEEIVVKPVGHLLKDIAIYQGTTILGDGRVIMILDVAGIAAQFDGGAIATETECQRGDADHELAGNTTTMLVFDAGGESTMAVPLSLVSRLEEFPTETIERTGERMVVQYRDNLLPLLPIDPTSSTDANDQIQPVVVFSEGDRSMGLVVKEILDIREEPLVIRMPSSRPGVLGTAIINNKATDVIDAQYYVEMADPDWFQKKSQSADERVLVIDDSVFFRQLVTTTLETAGYQVRVCNSAVDAVEAIENGEHFDLIISDIEMPMMDGYEFAQWYEQRCDDTRAPLIALTSLSGADLESRAQQAGFARCLTKLNTQQFLSCVQELCHQRGRQGASA
ncbi:Chemotaxis protein CheA [Symmachiella macrocystis]|uniref:histidine kinase n=1 Tax=Symmachiella macrocystis TaxID=2527985 RepID=A0A5C6BT08_9PLAN|nr:chemotaxis protein CheW [Symmachiella macrocystis]TWU14912.1 Chemotaxis protein CheA [Symmachiella macrocystis]